jgi:hypothetical protein
VEISGVLLALLSALPVVFSAVWSLIKGRRVQQGKTIKLEIDGRTLELTDATGDEQRARIDAWLTRLEEADDGDR